MNTCPIRLLLCLAFATVSFATAAFSQVSVRSNVVGYQRIHVAPGDKAMASVPFTNSLSLTVEQLLDGQLDAGTSAANSDVVRAFDRTGEVYRVFYPDASGGTTNWSAGADLEALLPGKGVWIENNVGTATNTVWLYGDVPTVSNITVAIRPGLQMVHNPYPVPIQLLATTLTTLGHSGQVKSQSDLILQWNQTFDDYDTYWLFDDAGTRRWVLESADSGSAPVYSDLTLEPGRAFWYQRKKDLSAFDWTVTKPYSYP